MKFKDIHIVYLIGIGGIGMSALARYFHLTGKKVVGYDKVGTSLTKSLQEEGISVHYQDRIEEMPGFLVEESSKNKTLVIYTPAIPQNHAILNHLKKQGFTALKRARVLGMLSEDKTCIAVGGTHGKTSISTMCAHIMQQSSNGCNAFLGGIAKNFNTNLFFNAQSRYIVTEADEYDRSFLQLSPSYAVITSMDADHLDIYGNISEIHSSFNRFSGSIEKKGALVVHQNIRDQLNTESTKYTYALDDPRADFYAQNIRIKNTGFVFDLITPFTCIEQIQFPLPGMVNIENAIAAASIPVILGINNQIIKKALETFKGVKRRFDIQVNTEDSFYMDDYAHHPREIEVCIRAVRDLFPGKKITGIFQPHLFSRTNDLAGEFAQSLDQLDEAIIMNIYPAREKPIKGVTSKIIYDKMVRAGKHIYSKEEVLEYIKQYTPGVLITMGAGDIDQLVRPIKQLLMHQEQH
ncbi:MAG: UDP-N-acetylmuramate--L-alanine ligase [Bacteroidota bacterium]